MKYLSVLLIAMFASSAFASTGVWIEFLKCEIPKNEAVGMDGDLNATVFIEMPEDLFSGETSDSVRIVYNYSDFPEMKLMADLTAGEEEGSLVGSLVIGSSPKNVTVNVSEDIDGENLDDSIAISAAVVIDEKAVMISGTCELIVPIAE